MRYFIYYSPNKCLKRIDVVDGIRVQEIIEMVQREFGLRLDIDEQATKSIVLNYNGSDLKPTWLFTDLNIPSGAIIHCLYREKKTADLHVHCGFNNQVLEFFDDTITMDTTIGNIRRKISDRIGLPLSTFCLEMPNSKRQLYDQMRLFQYEIKPQDHVHLKVWRGYENFLISCMKGIPKYTARDDLTRHYELQIALHIAAFYGFMALAHSALQLGARSDYPVGQHPSRQWSSEATVKDMPEMLKCPIHVAIERGHLKIVDLFVRHSLLCTQLVHPISGYLPYRMALSLSLQSKTKSEKQLYSQIYLYLYDKQFNLKISLNAPGSNISNLSTSNMSVKSLRRSSFQNAFFSLPRYCKIIRWYERARERVWKKYGVPIDGSVELKRSYQSKGLLGYKILIDGFNNTFDTSNQVICRVSSSKKMHIDRLNRYISCTDEEREKILKTGKSIKQFGQYESLRRQDAATINAKKIGHHPLLAQRGIMGGKVQPTVLALTNLLELSDTKDPTHMGPSYKSMKHIVDSQSLSNGDQHEPNQISTGLTKTSCEILESMHTYPPVSTTNENKEREPEEYHTVPLIPNPLSIQSTIKQAPEMVFTVDTTSNCQTEMSSADAYILSSARLVADEQQYKIAAHRERLAEIEYSLKYSTIRPTVEMQSRSVKANRGTVLDINHSLVLPRRERRKNADLIQPHFDPKNRQATIRIYERYAGESAHQTAVNCLQEVEFLKRKSWFQQVKISEEMIKQRTKRYIRSTNHRKINRALSPIRAIDVALSTDKAK